MRLHIPVTTMLHTHRDVETQKSWVFQQIPYGLSVLPDEVAQSTSGIACRNISKKKNDHANRPKQYLLSSLP